MLSNKKLNSIVPELFIRGIKLNIYLVFITKSHFEVPKGVRLNTMHFFLIKMPHKQELEVAFNHSSDIEFKDFISLCKKYAAKSYCFLSIDATLASDNLLRLRKNFLETI